MQKSKLNPAFRRGICKYRMFGDITKEAIKVSSNQSFNSPCSAQDFESRRL